MPFVASNTFPGVETPDPDTEIFERIPWESLRRPGPDFRWLAYLLAAVIAMGAVGVSIGRTIGPRQVVPAAAPAEIASPLPAPTTPAPADPTVPTPPQSLDPLPPPVSEPGTWSEADLRAVGDTSLEMEAAGVAEWFVVRHFTREAEERSFIDWSGPVGVEWVAADRLRVVVVIRRLAAVAGGEYARVPDEGWAVTVELGSAGWTVVDGPAPVPELELSVAVPEEMTEWTDPAGLTWSIREADP